MEGSIMEGVTWKASASTADYHIQTAMFTFKPTQNHPSVTILKHFVYRWQVNKVNVFTEFGLSSMI